jgi:adenosyl cobinamide kinase/adenosyl cobinamide phosphate guanylyltransferase
VSLVFFVGGARSGKTAMAVERARATGERVTVIATAEPRDDEMTARIRAHREQRPADWRTIEEALQLDHAIDDVNDGHTLVIDCLTLWVSNLLERGDSDGNVEARSAAALERVRSRAALTLVISNEVGLGIVPANELARRFRDVLGRVNATWAEAADEAFLLVAGRALRLP